MEPQSNIGKSFGYTTQIKDLTVISKPSFFYLTSAIYPLEFIDSVISKSEEITGRSNTSDDLGVYRFNQDNVKTNITQISGTLKVALKVYSYYKGEQDIDKVLSNVTDVTGILREVLLRYNINFENIKTSIANVSAVLRSALILYAFYKEEKIFSAVTSAEMFSDALPLTYTSFIEGSNGSGVQPMFAMSLFNYAETNYTSTYTSSGFSSNIVNLNFKEELTELDSHNLVLTFGKKTSSSGTKPPEVEVNEYTTVALDFENDLIDKIPTTIWQTQGTATVEEDNIILGKKSLETKALGDSLYTNSNVITGGSTPYTIDFYFIYKDKLVPSGYGPALLSQSQVGGGGEQEIMVNESARTLIYFRSTGFGSNVLNSGHIISNKYGINEITKCTITYDGSAHRIFLNDKLSSLVGITNGWVKNTNPFMFLKSVVPDHPTTAHGVKAIIDNINIHDGIATKVRNHDPYEDYLVVDLAFDGENNSTKIIDNARLKERNEIKYNDNVVSLLHFNNNLIDEVGNTWSIFGNGMNYELINGNYVLTKINGSSGYIQCSNPLLGDFGHSNFTIEFNATLPSNSNSVFSWFLATDKISNSGARGWQFGYDPVNKFISFASSIRNNNNVELDFIFLKSSSKQPGTTYHVCVTRLNDTFKLYINGILEASQTKHATMDSGLPIFIGSSNESPSNTSNGFSISELRIVKNSVLYLENFTPPTETFKYIPKNNWIVNGNAKISTDQKFDGFSSLYLENNSSVTLNSNKIKFEMYEDFTISFEIIRIDNPNQYTTILAPKDSNNGNVFTLNLHGYNYPNSNYIFLKNKISFVDESPSKNVKMIYSNTEIKYDAITKVSLVRKVGIMYMYVNGKLDASSTEFSNIDIDLGNIKFGDNYVMSNTSFKGYIKNFKIYKGVAIIPENPVGKIQLDFDNNVNDKYGNSTWTNNGVTFDQVNSVKGYSAYFSGGSQSNSISTGLNNNLNFGTNSFNIEFDTIKKGSNAYPAILASGQSGWPTPNGANISFHESNIIGFEVLNASNNGIGLYSPAYMNTWYKYNMIRKNSNIISVHNDVLVGMLNVDPSYTINFNGGDRTVIGGAGWGGGSSNAYNGYIDNFKSIKDSIETDFAVYPTYTYNLKRFDKRTISLVAYDNNSVVAIFKNMPKVYNFILEFDYLYLSDEQTGITFMGADITPTFGINSFGYILYMEAGIAGFGYGGSNYNAIGPTKSHGMIIGSTYKIKIVSNNSNFKIYISDNLLFDITDSRDTIPYHIGVRTHGTNMYDINTTNRISNLIVKTLSGDIIYEYLYNDPINTVIDRPAVHLPLETNAINTGFTQLTINSVGNPTYTTVADKKCIKFEFGKYLSIASNNIFNLGTSSDFYIELDLYIPTIHSDGFGHTILNGNGTTNLNSLWLTVTPQIVTGNAITKSVCLTIRNPTGENYNNFQTSNLIDLSSWNNLKFYRSGNTITLELNGVKTEFTNFLYPIDLATVGTFIGSMNNNSSSANFDGYMTNFKMFVGTSEIPETYNDKKVLDLDFKPTGKSYLFKDNNNKCVIHPVNITQRDYQNSQYCCSFNGTNQYLQLGKNDLFNFGLDDFVIEIIFKTNESKDGALLHSGETSNRNSRAAILIGDTSFNNRIYIHTQSNGTYYYIASSNSININEINKLIVYRKNGIINVILNNILSTDTFNYDLNFNVNSNTYIGRRDISANNYWLNGTIYSIKVLRNTTDLTLLENITEDNGGGEVIVPLAIYLNNVPDYYNPAENNVIYVTGSISNAFSSPILLATINGESIDSSYINITSDSIEGIYNYSIGILTNDLEGEQVIIVTARADGEEAIVNRSFKIIRDIALDRPSIDLFGTSWYQSNTNKPVIIRKYNEEPMMYFDGYGCLYSTNSSWRFGLDKFTIELDFLITSLPINTTYPYHILSYGREHDMQSWYSLEILSTGVIRFNINKGLSSYVDTASSLIQPNTKYKLAVTRDSDYTVRIFLNGVKVAEKIDKTNMDNLSPGQWFAEAGNIMYLGRAGVFYNSNNEPERHFKGYMKNIYIAKNECLYTNNYTPSDYFLSFENKSLLSFDETDIGFTVKNDNYNSNITWSNTNCSVLNKDLVITNSTGRLLSSENNMYLLDKNNWTLDLVFTPNQIITESSLLDMRHNTNDYQGLLIKQSASDPTSITIYLGSNTATQAYSYIINTGVNSLVANSLCHLKIVRSIGEIIVFINGVRKNKTTINTSSINTSNKVCLGNDLSFTKGFSGKIRQFRIINGTATDVYAFPIIEGETLK